MSDFMEIYPATLDADTCQALITFFEDSDSKSESKVGVRHSAAEVRKSSTLELSPRTHEELSKIVHKAVNDKYLQYVEKYPLLKRYRPQFEHYGINRYENQTEGYDWHADGADAGLRYRFLSAVLYLNTVKEGGETEFRFQQRKISPVEGALLLFPAGWTHEHRGNPPRSGKKYIITSWIRYSNQPLL